ncbi:RNA-guided endonuclease InsQ/TnpB family protein [Microbacterium maritypicum]|uniref:RNA-guided endonuclease InsQ/TnpB family protein n=1 Tax=Microbacterium maritypicum TaxID=33918 RepID=UPI0038246953
MQLRYRFRVEPTPAQRGMLERTFGCCRVVFNDALARRKADHDAGKAALSRSALQKAVITDAKRSPERAWLSEVSNVALVQAHNDLLVAFPHFFSSARGTRAGKRVGFPRFRSRHDHRQTARFTRNGFSIRPNGRLFLAKIGEVRVRWSRTLPTAPSSATIIKDAASRYFASFVADAAPTVDAARLPDVEQEIGVDVGLKAFAVLSDGKVIDAPKFLCRAERKLRKAQQELARKKKGPHNRREQVATVARVHARVADARRDFHHQVSTQLIRENQTITVENLNVAGMLRNRRLAKSVADAGWASFTSMLEYKAARYGRTLHKIDRYTPTTRQCSACGNLTGPTGQAQLGVRDWTCTTCGTRPHRDHNAAINILAAGRAERLNAFGEHVSLPRRGTGVKFDEPTQSTYHVRSLRR